MINYSKIMEERTKKKSCISEGCGKQKHDQSQCLKRYTNSTDAIEENS